MNRGLETPKGLGDLEAQPEGGVHGDRNSNELNSRYSGLLQRLDRQIKGHGSIARLVQESHWLCNAQRLMAKLVAGNQQNRFWIAK